MPATGLGAVWPPTILGATKTWTSSTQSRSKNPPSSLAAPSTRRFVQRRWPSPCRRNVRRADAPGRHSGHLAARPAAVVAPLPRRHRWPRLPRRGLARRLNQLACRAAEQPGHRRRSAWPRGRLAGRAVSSGSSTAAVCRPIMMASMRPRSWCTIARERLVADPATVAGATGDLAVERHGPFGDHPRPALAEQRQIGRIQLAGQLFLHADIHLDARRAELGDAPAGDGRKRIGHARRPAPVRSGSRPPSRVASCPYDSRARASHTSCAPAGSLVQVRRASTSACGPPYRRCHPSPIRNVVAYDAHSRPEDSVRRSLPLAPPTRSPAACVGRRSSSAGTSASGGRTAPGDPARRSSWGINQVSTTSTAQLPSSAG